MKYAILSVFLPKSRKKNLLTFVLTELKMTPVGNFIETQLKPDFLNDLLRTYNWVGKSIICWASSQSAKKYEGQIEHLQINDVAIFRGSRCNISHGVVHRSPPISGKGYVRSLMCLNIPSSASSKEYLL